MSTTLNASTSTGLVSTADTSGTLELQSNGTTQLTVASTGAYGTLKSATAVASTSGTSIDFTSLPSWVKRVTCIFNGVSANGSSAPIVQLGTSGGVVTSGYTNTAGVVATTSNTTRGTAITSGIAVTWASGASAYVYSGSIVFVTTGSNSWVASGVINNSGNPDITLTAGQITLSGTLDRVRFTMVNGTDAFDAGTINIIYEG